MLEYLMSIYNLFVGYFWENPGSFITLTLLCYLIIDIVSIRPRLAARHKKQEETQRLIRQAVDQ